MSSEQFYEGLASAWGVPARIAEENVISELALRVAWMMKHDYARLLNAVYLLDVSERKFKEAMGTGSKDTSAVALAELILDRERQKFDSRKRYRQERSTDVASAEIDETKLPED